GSRRGERRTEDGRVDDGGADVRPGGHASLSAAQKASASSSVRSSITSCWSDGSGRPRRSSSSLEASSEAPGLSPAGWTAMRQGYVIEGRGRGRSSEHSVIPMLYPLSYGGSGRPLYKERLTTRGGGGGAASSGASSSGGDGATAADQARAASPWRSSSTMPTMTAVRGTATKAPSTPASSPPAANANRTTIVWRRTARPRTTGPTR